MARTLMLNVNWEPLHILDARRALVLVLMDKAEVVENSNSVVHSQHLKMNLPSIVRLQRYVSPPRRGRSIPLTRRTVVARDGGKCAYCGGIATTIDHIEPRSKGGPHSWENVVAACEPCNHRKRDRTPEQAKMPLLHQPSRPRGAHARLLLYSVDPAWEPYLLQSV